MGPKRYNYVYRLKGRQEKDQTEDTDQKEEKIIPPLLKYRTTHHYEAIENIIVDIIDGKKDDNNPKMEAFAKAFIKLLNYKN